MKGNKMSIRFEDLKWTPAVKKLDDNKRYFFGTAAKNVDVSSVGKTISTAVLDKATYYLIEKPKEIDDVKIKVKAVKVKKEKKVKEKKVRVKKERVSKKLKKKAKAKIKKVRRKKNATNR